MMLYKVVLTFKSVNKTLGCDHSNESYWAVLSRGTVYHDLKLKVVFNFLSLDETLEHDHSSESIVQFF